MKKFFALLLALIMVFSLAACSVEKAEEPAPAAAEEAVAEEAVVETTEISLWTFPVGQWGDEATVSAWVEAFEAANPTVKVNVEYLDYQAGDDKLNTAIEGGQAPDIIFEGPERLIANYAAKGLLLPLDGINTDGVYESVLNTCSLDGKLYAYPVSQTAHCMAINYEAFQAADALQYLNEETHTWNSVEDYFKALDAVYAATNETVTAVYCAGQGGDQGTRHLISNIAGGTAWSNAEHTEYTFANEANAEALAMLKASPAVNFDASIVGGDEINLFVQGILKIANCWNVTLENNNADALTFDAFPMAFPSDTTPVLAGGFYCLGIFDNKDEARAEAAKAFVEFMTGSDEVYSEAVLAAGQWPTRDLPGLYDGNEQMTEYGLLAPMMGDYYQITAGWAEARTELWNMLQRIGTGDGTVESILADMQQAQDTANAAAAAALAG